jgi:hypothetical protein
MVDWIQLAGMAGKAISAVRDWTDSLSQEREIFIPDGMINTAVTALLPKDSVVKSVLVECHDGFADLDILANHEGTEVNILLTFELQSLTINRHKQAVALRERQPPELSFRYFPSAWHKVWLLLQVWACRNLLRQHPLHHVLRKTDGVEISNGVYRIDLSLWVRQKAALIAALYAVDIRQATLREGGLLVRGAANVKSLETLRGLYQVAAGKVSQVRDGLSRPESRPLRSVNPD